MNASDRESGRTVRGPVIPLQARWPDRFMM